MRALLKVLSGPAKGSEHSLAEGRPVTLGRADDADIPLRDPSVSKKHCELAWDGSTLRVKDLGSTNGTLLEGLPVRETEIRRSCLIALGEVQLRVDLEAPVGPVVSVREAEEPISSVESARRADAPLEDLGLSIARLGPDGQQQVLLKGIMVLSRISQVVSWEEDPDRMLGQISEILVDTLQFESVVILLKKEEPPGYTIACGATEQRRADGPALEAEISRTVVDKVIREGMALLLRDATADERFSSTESIVQRNIRSALCVPISAKREILGALFAKGSSRGVFTDAHLDLLSIVGQHLGEAMARTDLAARLERLFFESMGALVGAIDAKDHYTAGHSGRVASLTALMAEHLGLSPQEVRLAKFAGLMHDVGKIGIPESILTKPDKLTPEEFAIIQQHPTIGAKILQRIDGADVIRQAILAHHERYDGSGYPNRVAGEEILLLGRILCLADAFDTMICKRSYKPPFPLDKVLSEVERCSGSQFDPKLVQIFLKLGQEGLLDRFVPRTEGKDSSPVLPVVPAASIDKEK